MKQTVRRGDRAKKRLAQAPGYLLVGLWALLTFFILGWIIAASLSTTREIFSDQLLSSGLHWENFSKALFKNDAILNLWNSVVYTLPSCLAIIFVCAPAAYCLARYTFKWKKVVEKFVVVGLGIPAVIIVMPLFSLFSSLKMTNSRAVMVLLYTAVSVPYTIYFLLAFFKGISPTFEEAAAIDGCGPVKTFWLIMFPLARPAVMTVTIFNFIAKWNEYFMALIFVNKSELRPVGVGLYATVQSMVVTGDWAGMFASVVIVFLPTVLIYIFLSRQIVAGVTAGGIKG